MPIYTITCPECGRETDRPFAHHVPVGHKTVQCRECGKRMVRQGIELAADRGDAWSRECETYNPGQVSDEDARARHRKKYY